MKESFQKFASGERLTANRVNEISDLSRDSGNQHVSNNLYRTGRGTVARPGTFEIYVSLDNSALLDGIWSCNPMSWNSLATPPIWEADTSHTYDLDTREADAGFVVGDSVRAIWDPVREMLVPNSIPPQMRIGSAREDYEQGAINAVVDLHKAVPFLEPATELIDPLSSIGSVISRPNAVSEGELVFVGWVSKGGFDYTNNIWLSGWEMNKAVC